MITFLGIKKDDKGWQHFSWRVTLNGVDIDYKTGLGHSKSPKLDAARCIVAPLWGNPKTITGYKLVSVDKSEVQEFLSVFNMRKVLWNIERLEYVYVKVPRVRDVL